MQPHTAVDTSVTKCDSCHTTALSTQSWLGATYVHPATVTQATACGSCHNGVTAATFVAPHAGLYASAPMTAASNCSDCHTNALLANGVAGSWTSMTVTMAGVTGTGTFIHTDVTGFAGAACSTCHNGTYAQGKPTGHLTTSAACDSCHTTAITQPISWLGAVGVVHTTGTTPMTAGGVTVAGAQFHCASCHNGTIAKGISAGHIPVGSMSCDGTGGNGCHSTNLPAAASFAPGSMGSLEHGWFPSPAPMCSSCHNGSYASQGLNLGGAVGMVTNHITTTSITPGKDCNYCHSNGFVAAAGTAGWVMSNGQMQHNGAQGGGSGGYCVTCHLSGVSYLEPYAQKKNHNGSSTAKDCSSSSCHKPLGKTGSSYTNWGG